MSFPQLPISHPPAPLQRGIVVHSTHRSLVHRNVVFGAKGAGIYIEVGSCWPAGACGCVCQQDRPLNACLTSSWAFCALLGVSL